MPRGVSKGEGRSSSAGVCARTHVRIASRRAVLLQALLGYHEDSRRLAAAGIQGLFRQGPRFMLRPRPMTTRIDTRFADSPRRRTAPPSSLSSWPAIRTWRPRSRSSRRCPQAGADVIEIGMPFTDPMADGPAIQAAGLRALQGRHDAAQDARARRAISAASDADDADRADGLLQSDLCLWRRQIPARRQGRRRRRPDRRRSAAGGGRRNCACRRSTAGLNFIRLATPTTDDGAAAGGARQYVGLRLLCLDHRHHRRGGRRLRARSRRRSRASSGIRHLPVAVGFGVKNAASAAAIARHRRWRRGRLGAGRGAAALRSMRRQGATPARVDAVAASRRRLAQRRCGARRADERAAATVGSKARSARLPMA